MASSGEIGRSLAPPIPCARVMPSPRTSAGFELHDGLLERVRLDVDDARLLDGVELERRAPRVVLELLLGARVHVDLAGRVRRDLELDLLTHRDLDPVAVRRHGIALD